jgi:uncharacterized protein YjiS (DUF1127 family)
MRNIDLRPGSATLFSTLALAMSPMHGAASARGSHGHTQDLPARTAAWLRRARDTIGLWRERTRGRQQLLLLDDHVLRDIGITRPQAEAEANKPFWRA